MKKYVIGIVLVAALFIVGCSAFGNPNSPSNPNKKYYTGYSSLDMQFVQDSPPINYYYDPQGDNEIPIVVQIKNLGASYASGALYIHGYDPHMIDVAGNLRPGSGNVHFSVNSGGGFSFNVGGIYIGLPGHTGGGSSNVNLGFMSSDGHRYGINAFTSNGQLRGLNVNMRPGVTGYYGAQIAFQTFSASFGWGAPIALEGNTQDFPGGGLEVYEFPAYIHSFTLPDSMESFQQPIWITACFNYETRSTTMVCIDPKPSSGVKKACRPMTVSAGSGQGAPVAITQIQQQASNFKTTFTIFVHLNKQNSLDEIYDPYLLDKCNPESGDIVKPTDKNVVYVASIFISDQDITANCIPDSKIRLDASGNGVITCSAIFDGSSESAYAAPLTVDLVYGYSKSIYRVMNIKKI